MATVAVLVPTTKGDAINSLPGYLGFSSVSAPIDQFDTKVLPLYNLPNPGFFFVSQNTLQPVGYPIG